MRREGWEGRLFALLDAARARPYVLGEHDCFRVACQVVEALTGADRWPEFAGYTTKREAMARMAEHGATFEAAFDWFFGAAHVSPRFARRGDICAVQTDDGEKHLGVCIGAEVALLGPEGLRHVPLLACQCAWRVS